MGLTRAARAAGLAAALALAPLAAPAQAAPRAAPPAAPCLRCPDSLTVTDGTPGIELTGRLSRVDGHVVLDGCMGRVTLEDVLGESVEPLVGREAWLNAVCTGRGRAAAMGGHALGDSVLDVFVMSFCPFGRALEHQIATRVLAQGDSLRLPEVRVHWLLYDQTTNQGPVYLSHHGDNELREDVVQMTIHELEPAKFWPYLLERSGTDTTWTAIAGRVGLGWRTLTEIQRRLEKDVQTYARAEWTSMALNWPHIEGSPTIFWMGRPVRDIADVPGFGRAVMPKEKCKD